METLCPRCLKPPEELEFDVQLRIQCVTPSCPGVGTAWGDMSGEYSAARTWDRLVAVQNTAPAA